MPSAATRAIHTNGYEDFTIMKWWLKENVMPLIEHQKIQAIKVVRYSNPDQHSPYIGLKTAKIFVEGLLEENDQTKVLSLTEHTITFRVYH